MSQSKTGPAAKIGSVVKVKEQGMDEEEVYRIGDVTKANDNQVAPDNAMGKALLGAQPGDEVTVEGPTGPIQFEVLDVQPKKAD